MIVTTAGRLSGIAATARLTAGEQQRLELLAAQQARARRRPGRSRRPPAPAGGRGSSRRCCSGVRPRRPPASSPATRPSSVAIPVASTRSVPRPAVTLVPGIGHRRALCQRCRLRRPARPACRPERTHRSGRTPRRATRAPRSAARRPARARQRPAAPRRRARVARRDLRGAPSRSTLTVGRRHRLQRRHRPLRPVLLPEPDPGVEDHDHAKMTSASATSPSAADRTPAAASSSRIGDVS